MPSARVRLEALTKTFGAVAAVDRLSLAIEPGSMTVLLGPSGCGKTTCLRMLAGLVEPTGGEIVVNDRPITRVPVHRRNIGMLFQNYALFPHMSVAENVAFGLQMRKVPRAELKRRVRQALDLVQLGGMGARMPSQLSGGQQQRVGLARGLVIEPEMLLLDEPLGALDKGLRESMQVEIRNLQRRLGLTTIMVTHDQDEALTMADQVVVMRAGRLEQTGPPAEIYARPANRFVAEFIGVSNVFTGRTECRGDETRVVAPGELVLTVRGRHPDGSERSLTVRPESIRLNRPRDGEAPSGQDGAEPNRVSATIDQIIYRGFVSHYHLRTDAGQRLVAFSQNAGDATPALAVGDRVEASWDIASTHMLADDAGPPPNRTDPSASVLNGT